MVLVGAGPGDPGLLTLNALRALQDADVILHDRLVSDEVLALARRDADRIPVGKEAGAHSVAQARINELMIEHARAGRRVVRLKGGDPFIFGRGGEELEALRAAGIAYEVVPGITAALACAAYAGIPLTHRRHAQSLRLVTAHCGDSLDTLDWASLARERQTLVFYMGVSRLAAIGEAAHRAGPRRVDAGRDRRERLARRSARHDRDAWGAGRRRGPRRDPVTGARDRRRGCGTRERAGVVRPAAATLGQLEPPGCVARPYEIRACRHAREWRRSSSAR